MRLSQGQTAIGTLRSQYLLFGGSGMAAFRLDSANAERPLLGGKRTFASGRPLR